MAHESWSWLSTWASGGVPGVIALISSGLRLQGGMRSTYSPVQNMNKATAATAHLGHTAFNAMSDKRLDHWWRCSIYTEERNDAGVMVSVISRGQEQHDASSRWRVSSAQRLGKSDVSNFQHVQSVATPVEAHMGKHPKMSFA